MKCLLLRAFDYEFLKMHKTPFEQEKTSVIGTNVGGFLVWRRTLLVPVAALYMIAVVLDIIALIFTYKVGPQQFIRNFVGELVWQQLFCPNTGRVCKSYEGLLPTFWIILATDSLLALVALFASAKILIAERSWSTYRISSRHIRTAYGMIFIAPFALLFLFPPAQFINLPFVQTALCRERMQELIPGKGLTQQQKRAATSFCTEDISTWATSFNQTLADAGRLRSRATGTCDHATGIIAEMALDFADDVNAICIDTTGSFDAAQFPVALDSCEVAVSLGLCTVSVPATRNSMKTQCPAACGYCEAVACADNDAFFAEVAAANGSTTPPGSTTPITTCAAAAAPPINLCNAMNVPQIRKAVRTNCPVTCGVCAVEPPPCRDKNTQLQFSANTNASCAAAAAAGLCANNGAPDNNLVRNLCQKSCSTCPAPSGRRLQTGGGGTSTADLLTALEGFDAASDLVSLDGCVDPVVGELVGALEVALSDEVIIGAVALRRSSTVLLTLLPAALGLGLGAGQGMTVAKSLFPSSRLPSRLAGLIVTVSIPTLAALLGFLNQLLASGWGTLACAMLIACLSVWMPLGVFGTIYRALGLAKANLEKEKAAGLVKTNGTGDKLTDAILYPSEQSLIVKAIARRKYMLTLYFVLAIGFLAAFFGFSSSVSMVTEQLEDTLETLQLAASEASSGEFGELTYFGMTLVSTIARLAGMSYLAQIFYVDMAVMLITGIWHNNAKDDDATKEKREAELREVAAALGYGNHAEEFAAAEATKKKAAGEATQMA